MSRSYGLFFLLLIIFPICSCHSQDAIEGRRYDLTSAEIPVYFSENILEKESLINDSVKSFNDNYCMFLFFTDAHWGMNQKNTPYLINHIIRNTPVRDVIFGGDVITYRFNNKEDALRLGRSFRAAFDDLNCNMYYIYGNHDNNSDAQPNVTERHLSDEQVYTYLQQGMAFCEYGNYFNFYFDREESKTRFVCLDTGRYYYEQFRDKLSDTADYLINVLNGVPEGWNVVVLSHLWYELTEDRTKPREPYLPDYSQSLIKILDDYNQNNSGHFIYGSNDVNYSFSKNSSKVICCIGGHCHMDAIYYSEGGIPIIITTTDSEQTINNDQAIRGTISEQSISAFILDYSRKLIKMYRIGRGEDAIIPMTHIN